MKRAEKEKGRQHWKKNRERKQDEQKRRKNGRENKWKK